MRSHVDVTKGAPEGEPGGKKPKKAEGGAGKAMQGNQEAPRCACGGVEGRCDPGHVHHKESDVADELANLGRIMPEPCTDYHSPLTVRGGKGAHGKGRESVRRGYC